MRQRKGTKKRGKRKGSIDHDGASQQLDYILLIDLGLTLSKRRSSGDTESFLYQQGKFRLIFSVMIIIPLGTHCLRASRITTSTYNKISNWNNSHYGNDNRKSFHI